MTTTFTGNIINIFDFEIYYGEFTVSKGRITDIKKLQEEIKTEKYYLPGLIDAHVHVESSLLTPSNFARMAVVHGTVGSVSDPHEIANVLGLKGVEYMIRDAHSSPFKFCFGAPSCVPATTFETAGAVINLKETAELLAKKEIGYLAEMMNYPGVLNEDEVVLEKLKLAKAFNKPVDGHAPGLRGAALIKYILEGISTDHECFKEDEAAEKLKLGMKILIREGSAAKNFEALEPLINENYRNMMFCSDDKHPDSLLIGHINELVKRAILKGNNLFKVLQMACLNPVLHYRMNVGLLREGDLADFIVIDSPENFRVLETYITGDLVAQNGMTLIPFIESDLINYFECTPKAAEDFNLKAEPNQVFSVIEVLDGQLITNKILGKPLIQNGFAISDLSRDMLKIAVINRYQAAPIAIGFIHKFGLKVGALASSVAHDSHNIIVVGTNDFYMAEAVNLIIAEKGGLSVVSEEQKGVLPLPIAGLMSQKDGYKVAQDYTQIDQFAKEKMGCTLNSPFMSLSFMALLVIPALKISDKGMFDAEKFEFI